MVTVLVVTFLVTGLSCLWMALINLSRLDWKMPDLSEGEPEAEGPRLTRLGRPIEEVQYGE